MDEYCDKCRVARARYKVWIDKTADRYLVLCNHHFFQNSLSLQDYDYEKTDDEELVVPTD